MTDIITIGELLIDLIGQEGKSLKETEIFKRFPGGAPANVAVGIARLGGNVGIITKVGNDFFGDFLLSKLKNEGVDTSQISVDPLLKTGLAWVGLDEEKKPTFAFHRTPCADLNLQMRDINTEYIKRAKILHYGTVSLTNEPSRSAIFHAVNLANEQGLTISCDPNFRKDLWKDENPYPLLLKLISKTQILKISREDAIGLTGDASDEAFHELLNKGLEIILVTMGNKGTRAITKDKEYNAPAFKVNVVDTTGAGDAFMAGFLYMYHKTKEIHNSLIMGNKVACLSLTKMGATSALPNLKEVNGYNFIPN